MCLWVKWTAHYRINAPGAVSRLRAMHFHQDIRQAFRLIRKAPWFTAASVDCPRPGDRGDDRLIFSLVDAALLRAAAVPRCSSTGHDLGTIDAERKKFRGAGDVRTIGAIQRRP